MYFIDILSALPSLSYFNYFVVSLAVVAVFSLVKRVIKGRV